MKIIRENYKKAQLWLSQEKFLSFLSLETISNFVPSWIFILLINFYWISIFNFFLASQSQLSRLICYETKQLLNKWGEEVAGYICISTDGINC